MINKSRPLFWIFVCSYINESCDWVKRSRNLSKACGLVMLDPSNCTYNLDCWIDMQNFQVKVIIMFSLIELLLKCFFL